MLRDLRTPKAPTASQHREPYIPPSDAWPRYPHIEKFATERELLQTTRHEGALAMSAENQHDVFVFKGGTWEPVSSIATQSEPTADDLF